MVGFPKIIHQTWKDENIPERWQGAVESCKKLNPGYEYRLWTDKELVELVKKDYSWLTPTFTGKLLCAYRSWLHSRENVLQPSILLGVIYVCTFLSGARAVVSETKSPLSLFSGYVHPIQRADAIRYVLMHKFGGVYLDIDTMCLVSFDFILNKVNGSSFDAVMAGNNYPAVLDPALMMSKKGNPFMEFCLHRLPIMDHTYILPHLTVFYSTGPYFLSLSYLQYPCHRNLYKLGVNYVRREYFIHEHGSTWKMWDIHIIHFFEDYFVKILIFVIFIKLAKKYVF